MSFLFRKQSKEGKRKTDHRLYLAKENPEPSVDLSECDLYEVPQSVYAQCKYLHKEVLLLHTNHLRSLKTKNSIGIIQTLQVLDLHSNELSHLPDEIGDLSCLQVLNVGENKLKILPSTLGKLSSLTTLIVRGNLLSGIPPELGRCKALQSLDASDNPQLVGLPPRLAYAQGLQTITVDVERFSFPPRETTAGGTESIMKFLCESCGIEYEPKPMPTSGGNTESSSRLKSAERIEAELSAVSEAARKFEDEREKRRANNLAKEQEFFATREEQMQLAASENRQDLLKRLAQEQAEMDEELAKQQERRHCEKLQLLSNVQEAEKASNEAMTQRMREADRLRAVDAQIALQHDREELEKLSNMQQKTEDLRRHEVLEGMQALLMMSRHQELLSIAQHASRQKLAAQQVRDINLEADKQVGEVLRKQDKLHEVLRQELANEELSQRTAFQALLLDRDVQHRRLTREISDLQEQLAKLSMMEMKRRSKQADADQMSLEEERNRLTKELLALMSHQEERTLQLQQLLDTFEQERQDQEKDYWLHMYQRLCDSKPESLIVEESSLEAAVVHVINVSEAGDYLAAFARHKITFDMLTKMTDDDLRKIGVSPFGIRQNILEAVKKEVEIEKRAHEKATVLLHDIEEMEFPAKPEPSAPLPLKPTEPSAPPAPVKVLPSAPELDQEQLVPYPQPVAAYPQPVAEYPQPVAAYPQPVAAQPWSGVATQPAAQPTAPLPPPTSNVALSECVICMDAQSNVVLLNCGHVCTCLSCSQQLQTCPLCRAPVMSVVRLYIT